MTAQQGCLFYVFLEILRILFYYHKGDIKIFALFIYTETTKTTAIIRRSYEMVKQSILMSAYHTLTAIPCDKGRPQVFFHIFFD